MPDEILKILLIEDSPSERFLVKTLLSKTLEREVRFEVGEADGLQKGIDLLAQNRWDAILLDLSLPDCCGFETFERMQREAPRIPILVLSGTEDTALALRALGEGAQDFLMKGQLDFQLLVRAIRFAIERKKAESK